MSHTHPSSLLPSTVGLWISAFAIATGHAPAQEQAGANWQKFSGLAGTDQWKCHTIHPDPGNDGPDGINLHDWDGDGRIDVLSNAEEGGYSRLYFNPGTEKIHAVWSDYIEFEHGPCEDSGIGDLDGDGDIDYVANGGWVFFNPGPKVLRDAAKWKRMILFDHERRVPTVTDIDGDGLMDLVVGGQEWFRQPRSGKHEPENWKRFVIGKNRWPMNCHFTDLDFDGDPDLVVPDRGIEVCWYENPGAEGVHRPWVRRQLHPHTEPMFMAVGDLNNDQLDDFVITGGSKGRFARQLLILLRSEKSKQPSFTQIVIDQAAGNFPKGVAILPSLRPLTSDQIMVIPKTGNLWTAQPTGDGAHPEKWKTKEIHLPGSGTRKKMDNAWLGDLDGDEDLDLVTTEENGGWGVIWFENPGESP